ncbi:MAG: carboxypeptidase M32 [Lachnospiraceae bacterium]|nr:carboxypeptidase M32 [Lachnospiraceae bacterium]
MELNEAKKTLMEVQSKISAYRHASELIYFDGATIAPKKTAENRAHTASILSAELYKLATGKETVDLLEFLDGKKEELSEEENRMVFLLLKDIRQMQKIPLDEYTAYRKLLAGAYDLWRTAKENNDFEAFRPLLEEIFETNIRFAGYCAPDKDPYDYWLDQYEDGLDKKTCDAFFDTLRKRIVPLLEKIKTAKQVDDSCLYGDFPEEKQALLSSYVMDVMGIDKGHCMLETTEHPFTISIGSHHDVRITTRYVRENFSASLFSVIHESGHALYDMASEDRYAYTALDGGVSMGIHESQSRFYENLLGRSRAYTGFLLPKIKEILAEGNPKLAEVSAEDFYKAINKVEPSLIRTEADEVTYCLHVMVRYELEKKAMAGELAVKDFPEEWNRLYKEYLGIDVPDDKRGVLQDSHWSGGSIGYFPSYALGSAYGAQFLAKMKESIDIEAALSAGDYSGINEWNKEQIWRYGQLYQPDEVLKRVLQAPFDAGVFADYLEQKYSDIYGINI